VRPVITRVERYAGRCPCCGGVTVAPVPEGLEEGTPFGPGIIAAALYLRYVHAISYQRLTRLFRDLFGVAVSEGALDSLFQRAKRHFDREVAAILARLRRSRVICSDETTVRINGRTPACAGAGSAGIGYSRTRLWSSMWCGRPAVRR
jgi:transposase